MALKKFKKLIQKLSEDPRAQEAIVELRAKADPKNAYTAASIADLLLYLLKYSGAFIGKKKARTLSEALEIFGFLIALSLILKKNIFDQPDVRRFLENSWDDFKHESEDIYEVCQKFVVKNLQGLQRKTKKSLKRLAT